MPMLARYSETSLAVGGCCDGAPPRLCRHCSEASPKASGVAMEHRDADVGAAVKRHRRPSMEHRCPIGKGSGSCYESGGAAPHGDALRLLLLQL